MNAQHLSTEPAEPTACPRCANPIAPTSIEGSVFMGCGACGGAWLDSRGCSEVLQGHSEAFVLLADLAARQATVYPAGQAAARCPACGIELAPACLPPTGTTVHICARHGTWFDRGALSEVARARQTTPASVAVVSWISEQGQSDAVAASIPSRLVAAVIDTAVLLLSGWIPMYLGFELASAGVLPGGITGWAEWMVLTLLGVGCCWTGQAAGLTWKGQTIGKYLEGIKVVRPNGAPAGFWRAVVLRSMLLPLVAAFADGAAATDLDGVAGWAALAIGGSVSLAVSLDPWLILLPARRALHDYIAGTKVVVTYVKPGLRRFSRVVLGTVLVFGVLGAIVLVLSKC